jgi:hypothetical protein
VVAQHPNQLGRKLLGDFRLGKLTAPGNRATAWAR